MSAQHTPGPWQGGARESGRIDILAQPSLQVHRIAEVTPLIYDHEGNEQRANARLIAAAPELLEALENVLGFCATNQGMEAQMAIDDARAALAKVAP